MSNTFNCDVMCYDFHISCFLFTGGHWRAEDSSEEVDILSQGQAGVRHP